MIVRSEVEARAWFGTALGCDAATLRKLDIFVERLGEENTRQNLVSAPSLENAWVRHLVDSAQLLYVPRETPCGPWLDLGSGAGFPGIVVALCRPNIEVTLVENRTKRVSWLESTIDALKIPNAHVAGSNLQSVATVPMATISARAFAPLLRLIEISSRFSTPKTQWLLPKGQNGRQELLAMPETIQSLFHVEQSLTDPDSVILVGRGIPRLGVARHR